MCGIVGIVGKEDNEEAQNFVLTGLKRLEYRGYDSAGLVVGYHVSEGMVPSMITKKAITTGKKKAVAELCNQLQSNPILGSIAIGHTRWKTHGKVSLENTHPHKDCSQDIFIVHNGMISNFAELKNELLAGNHKFVSETDTEVIAHLIEDEFIKNEAKDLKRAVINAISRLRGTFALVIMHRSFPGTLIAALQGASLVIGYGKDKKYIASDVLALAGYAEKEVTLQSGEVAIVTADEVEFMTFSEQKIVREQKDVDAQSYIIDKGQHETFMLKEIYEEPKVVESVLLGRLNEGNGTAILGGDTLTIQDELVEKETIYIVACGTAFYASEVGAWLLRKFAKYQAIALLPEQFIHGNYVLNPKKDFVIVVSQSGETADTIRAMEEAKRQKIQVFGVVNRENSHIANHDDAGIYTRADIEVAVASTKVYVAQITALMILTLFLARKRGMSEGSGRAMCAALNALPTCLSASINNRTRIRGFARDLVSLLVKKNRESMLVLGRGLDFYSAQELALKIKEISYIHTEAVHALEMKHGPIAMISEGYPVIIIANRNTDNEKNYDTIEIALASGAHVLVFGDYANEKLIGLATWFIPLPQTIESLMPIVTATAIHLFAYEFAVALDEAKKLDLDIDQPRNLAKSVTV